MFCPWFKSLIFINLSLNFPVFIFLHLHTHTQKDVEIYYCVLYICRCMWYLNTAMNPILYNLMSSKFRDGFIKLLKCKPLIRATSWTESTRKGTFHTASTNLSSSTQNNNNNVERIKEVKVEGRNVVKCVTIADSSNNQHINLKNDHDFIASECLQILSEVKDDEDLYVGEDFEEESDQVDDGAFYDALLTLTAGKESLV